MTVLRIALKTLGVLLLIPLIPVLIWWVYNRVDEAPTRQARHWFAPLAHDIADAQNAWLFMLGLGAAPNDDPIKLGRKRLDAYEVRTAQPGMPGASADELALKDDPQPFQDMLPGGEKFEARCDPAVADCLVWASEHAAQLDAIAQANALRQQRYQLLLDMPRLDELSTPSPDEPTPAIGADSALYRALTLRELADPRRRANGLQRLVRSTAFWRQVDEQGQGFWMKRSAERAGEYSLRAFDAVLDRTTLRDLSRLDTAAAVVLRERSAAQQDWEGAVRRHELRFYWVIRNSVHSGIIDARRYCSSNCLQNWLMAQATAQQATFNLSAEFADGILDMHQASARNLADAQTRVSTLWEANIPLVDSAWEVLRRMKYNFAGKTLVLISLPALPEAFLQHDREALRRMIAIKLEALKQNIDPARMAQFLAAQPTSLRNPFDGQPFAWDASASEIRYVPKWKDFKRPSVAYKPAAG
jgi:hypothetical protein